MTTVVVSSCNVASFPEGGGHLWVYLQYAQALRQLGCDVYWLESFRCTADETVNASRATAFARRMAHLGFDQRLILYTCQGPRGSPATPYEPVGVSPEARRDVFRHADLLLNFHYAMDPGLLSRFRRTALVDIDPGLLQFWISRGQLTVSAHDRYLTTGETVGTPAARFPDCGFDWLHIHPPVDLQAWPYARCGAREVFTTVSNWYGCDWLVDGDWVFDNTKRAAFMPFVELPRFTPQQIELAVFLTDTDAADRERLQRQGWRIRHSREVAGTPEAYQAYVQTSRGEFSCAKPSCMLFQNAWVSDRTLCYLASGRPAVVQDTGPSSFLPQGEGIFRFSTLSEAVEALAAVNADYERHRRAARDLVETHFDARKICRRILALAL